MRDGTSTPERREFTAALGLHPNDVNSLNGLGICRERLEDRGGAVAGFQAALAVEPMNWLAQGDLERVRKEAGNS